MIEGIVAWGAVYLITLFLLYSKKVNSILIGFYTMFYVDQYRTFEAIKDEWQHGKEDKKDRKNGM